MEDEKRRLEMTQFAEAAVRENPALSREELEDLIRREFYNEEKAETPVAEIESQPIAEKASAPKLSRRQIAAKAGLWFGILCGVACVALLVLYLADPPGIPWPPAVRNVAKALGEEAEISVVSQAEQELYMQQVSKAIAQEGREVFLGRQLADLINDAELAAASVRLLRLGSSETEGKDRARIDFYIKEHKLVYTCLVKNNQSQWQQGPEQERYRRLRDAVLATDKHVDVLYKAMQFNDTASMLHAMAKIRQSYVLVGAFPF